MKKIGFAMMLIFILIFSANFALADLNDGLIAYYPFDGNALDFSGNELHGYIHGEVTRTEDRFGNPDQAYLFESGYIQVPNDSKLDPSQFTIAAWINSNTDGFNYQTIVAKKDGGSTVYSLWIRSVESENHLELMTHSDSPSAYYCTSPESLEVDQWYHVAGAYDGNFMKVYVNGSLSNVIPQPYGLRMGDPGSLTIGAITNPQPLFSFHGAIDEVRFYNRALSEEEIQALLNEGMPCTLPVKLSYVDDTLAMDFIVGTSQPATWNAWITVLDYTIPLWSVPLPAIYPPVDVSLPIPGFPSLGNVGVLTALTTPENGIICSDWATVDTGPLSTREAAPTARELKDLFKNSQ